MTDEAADPRRPGSGDGRPDGPDGTDRDRTAQVADPPGRGPDPHAGDARQPSEPPEPEPEAPESDHVRESAEPPGHAAGPGPTGYTAGQTGHAGPDETGTATGTPGGQGYAAGTPGGQGTAAGTPGGQSYAAGAPGGQGYATGPPPGTAPFTSRYGLVRPRQGRYLAGVCAAIGRATNTDPILWRVLLAVLGFFGGIGIVVYVAAWLIIPAEGDSASPVESMLGRGRSSMSPVLVIVLGILVAVLFGYIVTDVSRAVLLGAAILIGGALLLNRNAAASAGRTGPVPPPGPTGPGPAPWAAGPAPAGAAGPTSAAAPGWPVPNVGATASAPSADHPGHFPPPPVAATTGLPTDPAVAGQPVPSGFGAPTTGADAGPESWYPPATAATHGGGHPGARYPEQVADATGETYPAGWSAQTAGPWPAGGTAAGAIPAASRDWPAPPVASGVVPPTSGTGYRPPFAPYGPYAPAGPRPPAATPPVRTGKPPKPPKPPRERSALGAATFSMIFVAIGVVAILDLTNAVPVRPSTYFAAVLITIALGLLVGAWFGRARWLIALGLVAAAALGISTLAESYEVDRAHSPVVWQPASHEALAVRYQTRFGDATLDLRQVDFTGQSSEVTVRVNFGKLRVMVPPEVDTTVVAEVDAGEARIFGSSWSGVDNRSREVTDLGADGAGGGSLRLLLQVTAGDVQVAR